MITSRPFLLRFLFLYVILYTLRFLPTSLGLMDFSLLDRVLWVPLVDWIGSLFTSGNLSESGMGPDTLVHFILVPVRMFFSALGALLWTRFETSDKKINYWFLLYLRICLGSIMFSYGLVKILPLQMHGYPLSRLLVTIGDSTTWGLTWNFMAFGRGYEIFTGLIEAIGGILLFHRRTRLLGGLILIGALINVVAINLFYGVPVKEFAIHLLFFTMLIVLPDAKRTANFLINRSVNPLDNISPDFTRRKRLIIDSFKWILVGLILFIQIKGNLSWLKQRSEIPLFGIYEVDTYMLNGVEVPPLATDSVRLKYLVIDNNRAIQMMPMNGEYKMIPVEIDTNSQKISLEKSLMGEDSLFVDYKFQDNLFEMVGVTGKDSLFITGQIKTAEDFTINQNRFNLIRTRENSQHNSAWPKF